MVDVTQSCDGSSNLEIAGGGGGHAGLVDTLRQKAMAGASRDGKHGWLGQLL